MAESEDEHDMAPEAVRAAAAGQLPLLLPLLDDPDPAVRQAAAWTVSHTRATETALPLLLARWERECAAPVRAELLSGICRLDRQMAAALAATALGPAAPAELRLAAVFACLDAEVPWTEAHGKAMLSLLPADELMTGRLDLERNEPLTAVVEILLDRGTAADREAAFALVDAALVDARPEVRSEALWAADRACTLSRSAPQRLLPALLSTAVDEGSVVAVTSLLGRLGPAASGAASLLTPLAGRNPGERDDDSDRALAALVLVAPEQAAPLLARALAHRPRALDAAAGLRVPADAPFPYHEDLLDAVRHRLARPETLEGNEPGQLTRLSAGWGTKAAAALPDLYAALPHHPGHAASAIAAIAAIAADCTAAERARAAEALRATAENGSLGAAEALYDLTGEDAPLLHRLAQALTGSSPERAQAAATAGALGPRARSLAPALRAALTGPAGGTTTPALDNDTALAAALWRITQDTDTVLPALESVFARAERNPRSQWSAARAARATALLGPAGRPLTPRLQPLLDRPAAAPAAVTALAAVADPTSLDFAALAAAALTAAETDADPMGALEAIEALNPDTLPPAHTQRLVSLAESDARVVRSGLETRMIHQDDTFQSRARSLIQPGVQDVPCHGRRDPVRGSWVGGGGAGRI